MAQTTYLADQVVSDEQIQEWVETFNQWKHSTSKAACSYKTS